jgi:hypothetical protein
MDKQEEFVDELVRDITKVGSISKSEVRRRINDLRSKDRDTLIEKITKLGKKVPLQEGKWFPMDDKHEGFNSALDSVKQIILELYK